MRRPLTQCARILLAAASVLASAAHAGVGRGDYRQRRGDALQAAHAPRLASVGNDVIRFSSTPALGGRAWIVELHRSKPGLAEGEVQFFYGHPSAGWSKVGWAKLSLSAAEYDELAGRIDILLARGEPNNVHGVEIIVCTDGPGYLTERRNSGTSGWLSGFCGEHPNNEIAVLMSNVVTRYGPMSALTSVAEDGDR